MTISTSTGRIKYTGNGSTAAFATNFKLIDSSHVDVYVDGTLKTETTHYTVSGVGDSTATVTFVTAPATGLVVILQLNPPVTQTSDFVNGQAFNADTVEEAFDLGVQLDQVAAEKLTRTLTAPITVSTSFDGTLAEVAADEVLKVTADGLGFESISLDDIAIQAALTMDNLTPLLTRSALGIDTADSPQFQALNIGAATDTTVSRVSAGVIAVEGNTIYHQNGTDVVVADGGTGLSSATAYAVLCGGTTSTGAFQSIASVGTAGQVLTSGGAGALPTFTSAGSLVFLSSQTASASATLDFTSSINSTYDAYLFVGDLVPATDAVSLWIRTSTDAGSNWDAGTSYAYRTVGDFSATALTSTGAAQIVVGHTSVAVGNGTGEGISFTSMLFKPSDARIGRIQSTALVVDATSTSGSVPTGLICSATNKTAADITGVRFLFSSGNIASGTVRMYGIKNA